MRIGHDTFTLAKPHSAATKCEEKEVGVSGQVPEAALTAIDRQGSCKEIRLLAGGGWSHAIPVATSGPEEAGNICIFCASRASPRLTCHG